MQQQETSAGRPTDWVNLLLDHDDVLERVRMLWRRGGGAYRPMVPFDVPIERLQTDEDWDRLELEETHFEWIPDPSMDMKERRRAIQAIVDDLWEIAMSWTRTRGVWCDFQLHGFDVDNKILFEHGRRLYLSKQAEESTNQQASQSRDQESTDLKAGRREMEWRIDRRLDQLLDRLTDERDKSAANARESLDAAKAAIEATPQLFQQAREVLCETIDYQRQQFDHIRSQSNGRYQAQAQVLSEMEQSKRFSEFMTLCRYGFDTLVGSVLPFADRVVEVLGNRNVTIFPEFKCAQQALAYLVLTLTDHQLRRMWGQHKEGVGIAMRTVFNQGAQMPDERQALEHVAAVALRMLGGEEFASAATPEQQLAARYIIGRMALYRLVEFEAHDDAEA